MAAKKTQKAKKAAVARKDSSFTAFVTSQPTMVWVIITGIALVFCVLAFNPRLGVQGDVAA